MAVPITGACLCGGVRFEVTEPFASAGYCHCTRCQRRTGTAASASARVVPGSLRILPSYRAFVAYAAAWEPLPDDGLPRFPEQRL